MADMKPWEKDWSAAPAAASAAPAGSGAKPWEKDWSAAATPAAEPPSFMSGVGTGLMDKVYGAAQIGAHLSQGDPTAGFSPTPQQVDETVRKREETLKKEGYDKGWGRTVGNIAGDVALTAPLSLIPGGAPASALARIGQGARLGLEGGAISGATQPVSGQNFGAEKAGQILTSGVSGAVGGAALSGLASAFVKNTPEAVDAFLKNTFRRTIKPTVAGKAMDSQVAEEQRQAVDAFRSVAQNKENLVFTDETGAITRGRTPETLDELGQAIEQTKRPIYKAYDDLAKAGEFNVHAAEEAASHTAVRQAQTELTTALARQSQGRNVYQWGQGNRAVAEAQAKLTEAQRVANAATEKANATREVLKRVQSAGGGQAYSSGKISTEPAIQAMMDVANTKAIQTVPSIRDAIINTAENLRKVGEFSATEMQDYIQFLNAELKSFYGKANIPPGVAQAKALLASRLRETLDKTIEDVAGPGYQALKNQYGALKAIEANVVKRAQVAGREPVGGGIIDRLTNIASVEEMARAVMTFDPVAMGSAATLKGAQMVTRHLKSPNRAVKRMFEAIEQPTAPPPSAPVETGLRMAPLAGGAILGNTATNVMGLQ